MKWSYFMGACILAWLLLLSYGAPIMALVVGTAGAAAFNWFQDKK
jgi:hypothetical protein